MVASGETLFQQLGCASCHREDAGGRGPVLVGLFGKPVKLDTGSSVVADEDYLREWNLDYSKMLWDWCTTARVPFVYASSAATYGGGESGYSDDESLIPRLKPLNPYGESKRLFDLEALASERRGATPPSWAGFKFFNVYGFGEQIGRAHV